MKIEKPVQNLDPTNLTEIVRHIPGVESAIAKERDERIAARAATLKRLRDIEAAEDVDYPRRAARRAAAAAAASEAAAALANARDEYRLAEGAHTLASNLFQNEAGRLENILTEGAHPAICEFMAEMREELDATRAAFRYSTHVHEHPITRARLVQTDSNKASVAARITAIQDAMKAADAMKILPDQSTVPSQLDAIRANLPAVM